MNLKERKECVALVEWASYHPNIFKYLMHIENERKCTPMQGAMRKKLGVKAGVSDFFFPSARGQYLGLWLEYKTKDGKLSEAQAQFLEMVNAEGYLGIAVYGLQEATHIISTYFKLPSWKIKRAPIAPFL